MDNSTLSLSVPESTKAEPQVAAFFEHRTCSIQYIVSDPYTGACAVIDPVLDYDEKAGSIVTKSADVLLQYI